jgi:hypothetical protein
MGEAGLPLDLLFVVLVVVPACLAVFFGLFAWGRVSQSVFRCRWCEREFRQKPWKRFPSRCPACHSGNWDTP